MIEETITVAVVDDEPITRMDISAMLTELGFQVIGEAGDGFDAVELCREKKPDVVLMDVKMPVFDGLSASRTILEQKLAGCVILLTAFQDRQLVEQAADLGVTGYLTKPVAQKDIYPTIQIALRQSQLLQKSIAQTQLAEKKLQEDRCIHKAQQLLMKQFGCSETEAYQRMRKTAMDKRVSVALLAQRLVEQLEKR